jgi:hypothetical protein
MKKPDPQKGCSLMFPNANDWISLEIGYVGESKYLVYIEYQPPKKQTTGRVDGL